MSGYSPEGTAMFHRSWPCGCSTQDGQCSKCEAAEIAAEEEARRQQWDEAMRQAPEWWMQGEPLLPFEDSDDAIYDASEP